MPKGRTKKKSNSSLLAALRFIATFQKATGSPEQTHCRLFAGYIVGSNGILSGAHPIQEDIQVCPHTHTFIDALEQAPGAVNLTKLDEQRLSVMSESFQAIVPCVSSVPSVFPSRPIAECDDRLIDAMAKVATLVTDGAQKLINASIQLRNGSCIASDGHLILEAWHGIAMPPLLIAPKALATAANKTGKSLYQFGFDDLSLTFHYSDGSWLKSQLYPTNSDLPDLYRWLNVPANPDTIAPDLLAAVERLEPFSEDGLIYFTSDGLRVTAPSQMTNAAIEFPGLHSGLSFNLKALIVALRLATSIHWAATPNITIFHGNNLRGALATKVG